MNKYLLLFALGILLAACQNENASKIGSDEFLIEGEAPGFADGTKVLMKRMNESGIQVPVDTTSITNEAFVFKGHTDIPQLQFLQFSTHPATIPFILENTTIKVLADKDTIYKSKIYGSKSNELMTKYNEGLIALRDNNIKLGNAYREARATQDTAALRELSPKIKAIQGSMTSFPIDFIKENESSYFSLVLIDNLLKSNQVDKGKVQEAFNQLDAEYKDSELGKSIATKFKNLNSLNIGAVAPKFEAPNPEGKVIALDDVLNKVTIIDFWASWCKPCRRENPNVVKLYEKYHDKGLEIIGVSLDKAEHKDRWIKAIEDDGLTWPQISNLKSWNEPIARLYNIRSIPATYILDENGVIIAKNLRGKALEDKVAELLD